MVVDCFTSLAMTKGKRGGEFFLFSVFLWWFCGLWIATTSTKSRNDEGGKGWYSRLLRSLAMTKGARGGIHKLVIARA